MTDERLLFPSSGDDVHVSVTSERISAFVDVDKNNLTCFRCGENGHVRFQCLTFRVRMCDKDACHGTNCTYAHHPEQLRTPWKVRCVRVVKQDGKLICIGCNSSEHTFRKCPLHKDMIIL